MTRAEGNSSDSGAVNSEYAGTADDRLTELLRTGSATAYPALRELRARHRPSVLAYARLCTAGEAVARQLTAHAFTAAARETARGTEPVTPLRHQLLLLVGRIAAEWADDERAVGLDAGLLQALSTNAPAPTLLRAFHSLPLRVQGLVWYGLVEREPEERVALLLGMSGPDVKWGLERALVELSGAALRTRLADSLDPDCAGFRRLIEESVRPDSPRHSHDLSRHMAQCTHCTMAYEEQCTLRDTRRTALAEGLLPWSGAAYMSGLRRDEDTRGGSATGPGAGAHAAGRRRGAVHASPGGTSLTARDGSGHAAARDAWGSVAETARAWPPSRRFALASAALGVAIAPLLLFLLSLGDPAAENVASHTTPTPPPAPAVTPTVTVTPSPSKTRTSPSPKPTPTPSRTSARPQPSATPKPPPSPTTHAPNGTYAEVVNNETGLCLDVQGGRFAKGNDVITTTCSGSERQLWRYDAERQVLQSYAEDQAFCLDSRGEVDRGVGIWTCESLQSDHGQNLMFSVDTNGVIHPYIASGNAVTDRFGSLGLEWGDGSARQRWHAGRTT
ncbi:hypothetical protein BN159_0393 [Streptomyces davaonensis JCM 4913]|uniref:Ricin B lectin domain-containing protein n=1 Tax=Streptomyces davaonensis (strain DSM 101723 / JCM 4913 / KCC S-0913 / 768) TaxID=1214101 RepID=K4QV19_STRDJ|nr:RICIN domain-containing protein [Streptomyces davaonensis]CCK24772.1 hypothetical protein BN159_0393 [Streptomyces davaonensis JCM 4913]